jgi:predicted Zn-dependent protease
MSNVSSDDFNATSIINNMLWWLKGNKLTAIKKPVSIELGKIYERTNSIDSSLKAYVDLKQKQPAAYDYSVQALSQFGVNLSFRTNKAQEGLKVFEFATQQFPSSAYAQVSLAEAYTVGKQNDKAKAALAKAKSLNAKEKDSAVTERIAFVDSTFKKQEQKAANTAKILN